MKQSPIFLKIVSLLLLISMLCTNTICLYADTSDSIVPQRISQEKLEEVILGMINWAKQGKDVLLNDDFLSACGSTPGDWFPIGMGRFGYKENEPYERYLAKAEENVAQRYKDKGCLHPAKATEWQRMSLAILAMGGDPTSFSQDKNGNPINLIADGSYNSIVKPVDRQGINGAIWAMIMLDSMNYPVPSDAKYQREDILERITKYQHEDGGFSLMCKPNQLKDESDPDITAMAVQSLAPYYNSDRLYPAYNGSKKTIKQICDESLGLMGTKQNKDGDFFSWGTTNVESTVQLLVALCSLGFDPYTDERFIKNGKTLIDGIMKYRCDNGGFAHSFVNDPENPSAVAGVANNMATEQTLYGLVSYWRLINGKRRLYDYRPDPDSELITFTNKDKSEIYALSFNNNTKAYSLSVTQGVKEIYINSLPFVDYYGCNYKVGDKISISDGMNISIDMFATKDTVKPVVLALNNYSAKSNLSNAYSFEVKYDDIAQAKSILEISKTLSANDKIDDNVKVRIGYIDTINKSLNELSKNELAKPENKSAVDIINLITGNVGEADKKKYQETIQLADEILKKVEKLKPISALIISDKNDINTIRSQIEEYIKQFKNYQSNPIYNDKQSQIKDYISLLNSAKSKIEGYTKAIAEISDMLEAFNEKIVELINFRENPITLSQKATIQDLMTQYNAMPKANQETLTNKETLLTADNIIKNLEKGIIVKKVFLELKNSDKTYKFSNRIWGQNSFVYDIEFSPKDVKSPCDFDANVIPNCENTDEIQTIAIKPQLCFQFKQQDDFPGNAKVTLRTNIGSEKYKLYKYDYLKKQATLVQEIKSNRGEIVFNVSKGGEYFIAYGIKANALSDKIERLKNYIPKEKFEEIMTTSKVVSCEGRIIGDNKLCTITFSGKDIKYPMDFKAEITNNTPNKSNIKILSQNPYIFKLSHNGKLPGEMLLEMTLDLPPGNYLLMSYNQLEKKAELVSKIDIHNHTFSYIIKDNLEYFITKEVNMDTVDEVKNASNTTSSTPSSSNTQENKVSSDNTASSDNQHNINNDTTSDGDDKDLLVEETIDENTEDDNEYINNEGETQMDNRMFTADEVLILLNSLTGQSDFVNYLIIAAILIGSLFIGICILMSNKNVTPETKKAKVKSKVFKLPNAKNKISSFMEYQKAKKNFMEYQQYMAPNFMYNPYGFGQSQAFSPNSAQPNFYMGYPQQPYNSGVDVANQNVDTANKTINNMPKPVQTLKSDTDKAFQKTPAFKNDINIVKKNITTEANSNTQKTISKDIKVSEDISDVNKENTHKETQQIFAKANVENLLNSKEYDDEKNNKK